MSKQLLTERMPVNSSLPKLVIEGAVFSQAEKVKKFTDGKVIFEAYLQECDSKNQNKRRYRREVLDSGMQKIAKKIQKRSFVGELDHPITDDQVRQTTVLYKESSHIIREWGWDGPFIRGVVETMPYTDNGHTLSGMVLDNISVGFSLRGLADLQDHGDYQDVMDPLIVITYDCVSEPSHNTAVIQEIRNENVVRTVYESLNLIRCSNGHSYEANTFDRLVEQKVLKLAKRYL